MKVLSSTAVDGDTPMASICAATGDGRVVGVQLGIFPDPPRADRRLRGVDGRGMPERPAGDIIAPPTEPPTAQVFVTVFDVSIAPAPTQIEKTTLDGTYSGRADRRPAVPRRSANDTWVPPPKILDRTRRRPTPTPATDAAPHGARARHVDGTSTTSTGPD
jgi:hypothetical protein